MPTNTTAQLTIMSASAGSGKTYALSLYYLAFLLHQPDPGYCKHILAISFTNKATNEIRERILLFLSELAAYPHRSSKQSTLSLIEELLAHIKRLYPEDPQMTKEELLRRARLAYHYLIHNLHEQQIYTIDSLINRLGQLSVFDLGIPLQYELTTNPGEPTQTAIEYLMAQTRKFHPQEQYNEWASIINTLSAYIREESLRGEILWTDLIQAKYLQQAAKLLFRDDSFFYTQQLEQQLSNLPFAQQLASILQQQKNSTAQLKSFFALSYQYAEAITTQLNLYCDQWSLRKTSKRINLNKFVQYMLEWQRSCCQTHTQDPDLYLSLIRQTLQLSQIEDIQAIEQEDKQWLKTSKTVEEEAALQASIRHIYQQLKTHIQQHQHILAEHYIRLKSGKQLFYLWLLRKLISDTRRSSKRIYLGELSVMLAGLLTRHTAANLRSFEYAGIRYRHLLIDEFQDTSLTQWRILYPILENAIAQGYGSLIVGDPKQSIYRWRGAEPRLLSSLIQAAQRSEQIPISAHILSESLQQANPKPELHQFIQQLSVQSLYNNHRSHPHIVAFNNQFFHIIQQAYTASSHPIGEIYTGSQQQATPEDNKRGGQVVFYGIVGKNQKERLEQATQRLIAYIKERQSEGYRLSDITVLCRKNEQIQSFISALTQAGIPAYASGSLLVTRSVAVNFLLAMLKSIAQPTHSLAKAEARFFFYLHQQQQQQKLTIGHDKLQQLVGNIPPTYDWEFYRSHMQKPHYNLSFEALSGMNVYKMVLVLIEYFDLLRHAADQPYVFRFIEEVYQFVRTQSQQVSHFIEYWQQLPEPPALQDGTQEAIRFMTIHKSKGLAFPITVLWADWQLYDHRRQYFEWVHLPHDSKDKGQYQHLPLEDTLDSVTQLLGKTNSSLEQACQQWENIRQQEELESLNLLYVALTRAKEQLCVLFPESTYTAHYQRISHLIQYGIEKLLTQQPAENPIQQQFGQYIFYNNTSLPKTRVHPPATQTQQIQLVFDS